MTHPITPIEAIEAAKNRPIPDVVLEIINEKLKNGDRIILQSKVVNEIMNRVKTVLRDEIFDNHWLDFEEHYRKAGWKVTYDTPGYCESYEAHWRFSS